MKDRLTEDSPTTAAPDHPVLLQQVSIDPDAVLTTSMLAGQWNMSPRTLEGWRVRGIGPPFVRLGPKNVGYIWACAKKWLEAQQVNSTSETTAV